MTTTQPERYTLLGYPFISDAIYAAAEYVRTGGPVDRQFVADLLVHIGDEIGDDAAAEVEFRDRINRKRMVVRDQGRGEDSDVWTAALALARSVGYPMDES